MDRPMLRLPLEQTLEKYKIERDLRDLEKQLKQPMSEESKLEAERLVIELNRRLFKIEYPNGLGYEKQKDRA